MTPSLAIGFSAPANGRVVSIDQDVILTTAHATAAAAGVAFLSTNPAATIANVVTTPADSADESIIAVMQTGASYDIQIPISAGSQIFVCAGAKMQVVLYFQLIT